MADVPFNLLNDAAGDVVATETTDEKGEFWFTGLKPGHYTGPRRRFGSSVPR